MDSEIKSPATKVDNIYKNILEKFNPSAKTLITNSKSYLKALHAASSSSKIFIESLAKLAVNATSEIGGGSNDIGASLMDMVTVFNSIEDSHMNVIKAFYVDFLLPLENNLEKDTKVISLEQKKFTQLHKLRVESFSKANNNMKKNRKKKNNAEKELKCIQALEEEKKLLDNFCDQSIKNALIQERRRYGFILERSIQSMAKHWTQYFETGFKQLQSNIDIWTLTAENREILPSNNDTPAPQMRNTLEMRNAMNSSANHYEHGSVKSAALRKSQSIHASTGSLSQVNDSYQMSTMSRHMSEHSLASSPPSKVSSVTALFAYIATGENQLSFYEGDKISVIGEKNDGWQFGENLRTSSYGWFPISYVQSDVERKSNSEINGGEIRATLRRNQETNQINQRDLPMNKYQKIDNPPTASPPPPPKASSNGQETMRHGSSTTNFSKSAPNNRGENKHRIYSSNDSGFDNETPPAAPEVDYSDDEDLPKKIPIRDQHTDKNMNTSSDTEDMHDENFSKMHMKQSNSYGNLTESNRNHEPYNLDSTTIKRNKSFWRFSKSEDILEGMALWKHRDLVPIDIEHADKEMTLKKQVKKMDTMQKKTSRMEDTLKKSKSVDHSDKRISEYLNRPKSYNETLRDDDNEIYDESPKRRHDVQQPLKNQSQKSNNKNYSREIQDTNFYDDETMVIKTVKRKEILKQYYNSSGTDTEISSDPYDCIIVDDHLVPSTSTFRNSYSHAESEKRGSLYSRSNKNNSVSGTLLPRTKLSKSGRGDSNDDRMNTTRSQKTSISNFGPAKAMSPWSNMWLDE